MADSDKDILITPSTGLTTEPSIVFTGFDNNPITLDVLDAGTLSFSGSSGQLFSISDDLTGTIFSVNDISGIPSIEVIDDGTVLFAEFSGNVLIGTATDNATDKVQVNGDVLATNFKGTLVGTADNAALLDNLDSLQFLRSDADDTTTGTLGILGSSRLRGHNSAGNFHLDADYLGGGSTGKMYLNYYTGNGVNFCNGASVVVANMDTTGQLYASSGVTNKYWHAGNDGAGSLLDADKLDGQEGSYYSPTTHNHTLDGLSNTTITTIASGELLKWSGSAWINNTLAEAGISATGHTHTESDITDLQSYLLNITAEPLSDLSDVTITSIASNEILKWSGSAWINNTLAEAGISAIGHTHTKSNITDFTEADYVHIADTETITGAKTFSSDTTFSSSVVQYSNRGQFYQRQVDYSSTLEWRKLADITFGTGNFTGLILKVTVTDTDVNWGGTAPVDAVYTFYVQMSRSSTVLDNVDIARIISDRSTSYIRVVRPSVGVFELQINATAINRELHVTVEPASKGSYTLVYVSGNPVVSATSGTTYTPTITPMGNADTLDSLASTQFLRSDVADTADGLITFNAGLTLGASQVINNNSTNTRDKIRVWDSNLYTIGMGTTYTYGYLNEYAMTFQMNNTANRGWWWGQNVHTNAQGAMSLTNDGRLYVDSIVDSNTFVSRVSTGTAPFTVSSTTVVANLNSDLLDGQEGSYYSPTTHNHTLAGLTDVSYVGSPAPIDGQVLTYDGSGWINETPITGQGSSLYEYTATASQTTFTGSDDNANILTYTVDKLLVILNGAVLDSADFTATNGTSVVLNTGADAGSSLNILAFGSITISNTYTKAESDAAAIAFAIAL